MKKIEVVAAVFINRNKVYCAQRRNEGLLAKKWEFPGGKIEIGETKEQALIREIKEELNFDLDIKNFFMTVNHQYQSFYITMHTFLCPTDTLNIVSSEHMDTKWVLIDELDKLDWADADIPVVKNLMSILLKD